MASLSDLVIDLLRAGSVPWLSSIVVVDEYNSAYKSGDWLHMYEAVIAEKMVDER